MLRPDPPAKTERDERQQPTQKHHYSNRSRHLSGSSVCTTSHPLASRAACALAKLASRPAMRGRLTQRAMRCQAFRAAVNNFSWHRSAASLAQRSPQAIAPLLLRALASHNRMLWHAFLRAGERTFPCLELRRLPFATELPGAIENGVPCLACKRSLMAAGGTRNHAGGSNDEFWDRGARSRSRVTASRMISKSTRPRLRDCGCADDFVRATVATIIMIVISQRLDQPRVTTGVLP
jgi:hypothetical protein